MDKHVIETQGLTVYYGRRRGIEKLDMAVTQGEVFGFLGPNGAGKTTTQRVLLDVIRPTRGQATIFGLDCRANGREIRRKVGYIPGELSLPGHLTAERFFDVLAGVRGVRDSSYRHALCEQLELDPSRRIREFSRGNKQKVGLVAAMMHRPELLILDEPTSGLDPLVQQKLLQLVREIRDEGRTVFLSSHVLSEVQAVCDRVGIIRAGQLIAVERVDALIRQRFRRLRLALERPPDPAAFNMEGVREVERVERAVTLEIQQGMHAVMERALQFGLRDVEEQPVTLEEIFLAYYDQPKGDQHA
jgi:ABC-2 type transport system ATP-binding protein